MKHLLGVIILSLLTGSVWGQQKFSLDCPDPEAKQACDSFKESKDMVQWVQDGSNLVCFRQNVDEYFTVGATFWGETQKQNDGSMAHQGASVIWVVNHGVEDDSMMPNSPFNKSDWKADGSDWTKSDAESYLDVSALMATFSNKYKNTKGDSIDYHLIISLDTKRFHEKWQFSNSSMDEGFGRCLVNSELWNAKLPK